MDADDGLQRAIELQRRACHADAIPLLVHASARAPQSAQILFLLGNSLLLTSRLTEAEAVYRRALQLSPAFAEVWNNLGHTLLNLNRARDAADAFAQAVTHRPDLADAHNSLGIVLKDLGQLDDAVVAFNRAVQLRPGYSEAFSNLAYTLHFKADETPSSILAINRQWDTRFAQVAGSVVRHANSPDPQRKLRIGYISPNLRRHPVGLSMIPILANHDREQIDAICFSDDPQGDSITQQLRRAAHDWHDTAALSHEAFAELVRDARIDIVIDLAMHMAHNRLPALARRPAPVQANFLAYPATAGLSFETYRITDSILDPPGATEAVNSERLMRLSQSFWCYPEPVEASDVGELPARSAGHITFGSPNNPCKVTLTCIKLWSRVLRAMPTAKLLMLSYENDRSRNSALGQFVEQGIEADRIDCAGRMSHADYLRTYQRIDIGLDPLPYNGHFTSCDSFWMGVPVISRIGTTSVGRGGASLIDALGLPDLLARDDDQFVVIATKLAGDLDRLATLRRTMRDRMRSSPLMDGRSFTRSLESLYRQMWCDWCAGQ